MLIRDIHEATAERMTALLTGSKALQAGQVRSVEADTSAFNRGYQSRVARLRLYYSADARGERPERLFLKLSRPEMHPEYSRAGRRESLFYRAMGERPGPFPIPHCYHAAYDEESGQFHLLLEDLSLSHYQRPVPIPPAKRECEQMVEALATLHARWWNHPQLGVEIGERREGKEMQESIRRLEESFPHFMDALGEVLLPEQRRVYNHIMNSDFLLRRMERLEAMRTVTLIHGDAHSANFLLPRHGTGGRALLIDWHLYTIDVPPYDLAFMMALHWSPERRAALEEHLVRHYHACLAEAGVEDYSWEECWQDYRESVIVMPLIPIGQFRRRMAHGIIWYGMEHGTAAFRDLHCAELL